MNPSSYFRIGTELSCGKGSNSQDHTCDIDIRISQEKAIVFVTVWNGLPLVKHARFIEIEPDVEIPALGIPAYKGKGDDPQIRDWKKHYFCVVLNLKGRQWVGQTWNRSFQYDTEFKFHFTPEGDAHALLLASDLIQHTCGFAPHLELGIGGMA